MPGWSLRGRAKAHPAQGSRLLIARGAWSAYPFWRLIGAQTVVALVAAALGWVDSPQAAHSALAGAGICGIANVYAAWRVFAAKTRHATQYGELANLYRAEFGKFVMIGGLSAILFAVSEVRIVAFVGACLGAILTGIVIAATFNPGIASKRNTKLQDTHGE
ncbi:MAG: hypothetical protein MAG794_01485 [Gammaproteobacteria bacterium]|nr:hypothetical protein [Gammaproteobacteria bacterium]